MNTLRIRLLGASLVVLTFACGTGELTVSESGGDHGAPVALEAEAVGQELGSSGLGAIRTAEAPFVRLGVLWDSPESGGLEVRTRLENGEWGAWTPVTVLSAEEGANAGFVDTGIEGAQQYQWKVAAGTAVPRFVTFEPVEALATPVGEVAPDDTVADADEVATAAFAATAEKKLVINSRASWGARAPKCITRQPNPTHITIHHTVTPTVDSMSPQARLRQIQNFHMDGRGYCDIAYNHLVSRDGRVWRGRGREVMGAHVFDANSNNIGISFMGTYTSVGANAAQICGAAKLISFFERVEPAISIDRSDVKGHRERALPGHGTECPGNTLFRQLDEIVRKARTGC